MGNIFTPPASAFSDSAPSDPHFSSVVLLLHGDGVDGSTTFTDAAGHTVTANGSVQIDTAQSVFGGASIYFNGTTDYLSVSHATDFDLSADFTIEFWARWESTPSATSYLVYGSNGWAIYRHGTTKKLSFYDNIGTYTSTDFVPANNQWYHVALVSRSGSIAFFIDGDCIHTNVLWGGNKDVTGISIGSASGGSSYFNGWIDDLRITKGVARYSTNSITNTVTASGAEKFYADVWAAGEQITVDRPALPSRCAELFPYYANSGEPVVSMARNGRIAGTLASAGVPKVDTWVFLTYRLTAQVIAGVRTDSQGRFEFTGLYPDAKYLVSAYESRTNPPGYNVVNADYITPVLM